MSVASTFEPFDRENTFYDLETWTGMFEAVVKDNPSAADSLALLMYKIIRILSAGEGGIETETVINTLKLGVEWVYPFSTAHKKSFKLYLYYLECVLTPQDSQRNYCKERLNGRKPRPVKSRLLMKRITHSTCRARSRPKERIRFSPEKGPTSQLNLA